MAVKLGGAKDYSAMQGPCQSGFHIPTSDEWGALYGAFTGLGLSSSANWQTYFKMPYAGYRKRGDASIASQGYWGYYWASSVNTNVANNADCLRFNSSQLYPGAGLERSMGESIRPFKDEPVIPDSSWTALYQGTGSSGIYHNSTLGLISISSDGIAWITIQDKNLGATTVYNTGDTLSEANCGKYYQRGNNYGFAWTGTLTTSSTQVNATNYGPGNYYSSSTFIIRSGTPYGWDSSNNKDLRGGVTGIRPGDLVAAYIGEYGWKPGANTIVYYPFENNYVDQMGNTVLSASGTKDTIGYTFNISGNSKITNGNATGKTALANQVFVSYWIKVNSYGSITQFPDATKDFFYDFYHTSSSYRKKWEYRPNSGSATYFGSASTTTGTRYYFAYGYDNGKIYVYFNGEQVGSATVGVPRTGVPRNVVSASNGCNFTISQLIGESACRTAEEILNYYNKTKGTYGL